MQAGQSDGTTRLYFIRHAESDHAVCDERERPLTAKGRRDAQRLARVLGGIRFDYLYSSPYMRAVDTIMPLANGLGVGLEIVEDFRERKPAGEWVENFDEFMERQWEDFSYGLPGGESLAEVRKRSLAVLTAICGKIAGRTAAIATHGTVLSVIINSFDPDFGYRSFLEILPLMPLVVRMEFQDEKYLRWEHVKLSAEDTWLTEDRTV